MSEPYQQKFQQRWRNLTDPHVRALAWLLEAPDLLDPEAAQWQGKLANLNESLPPNLEPWLQSLDEAPAALHRHLNSQPYTRLGRYAEKLMAFYFAQFDMLVAHGVQVRADKNSTIGEFDFLLNINDEFVHWEFATKFYLLKPHSSGSDADYFVGPNLADSLGAKMQKIFDRQLMLSQHPAAQIYLPQAVQKAQALVKGWLFYQDAFHHEQTSGTSAAHCHGFWCTQSQSRSLSAQRYAILPRLSWLAPAKLAMVDSIDSDGLQQHLRLHFSQDVAPVMVALLVPDGDYAFEVDRGFIVPDDWSDRAMKHKSGTRSFPS